MCSALFVCLKKFIKINKDLILTCVVLLFNMNNNYLLQLLNSLSYYGRNNEPAPAFCYLELCYRYFS